MKNTANQLLHFREATLFVLGAVFLASAGIKVFDVTSFAVQVSYYGIVREPAFVRAVALGTIAVEAALGTALLLRLELRRVTLPATMVLLAGFTALLAWAWAFRDLKNCGCFGKFLPMTPAEAILKNLALMVLVAFAGRSTKSEVRSAKEGEGSTRCAGRGGRVLRLGAPVLAAAAMVAFALANPWSGAGEYGADSSAPAVSAAGRGSGSTEGAGGAGGKFAKYSTDWEGKRLDLGKDVYVVAMLSDTCSHCAEIVGGLNRLAASPNFPPIVGLILGEEDTLRSFRATFAPKFPNRLIPVLEFFDLIGDAPPRFYVLKDGQVVKQWDETLPTEAAFRSAISAEIAPDDASSAHSSSTLATAPPPR